jgi:hypothetical protein
MTASHMLFFASTALFAEQWRFWASAPLVAN